MTFKEINDTVSHLPNGQQVEKTLQNDPTYNQNHSQRVP